MFESAYNVLIAIAAHDDRRCLGKYDARYVTALHIMLVVGVMLVVNLSPSKYEAPYEYPP